MNVRIFGLLAIASFTLAGILGSAQTSAQNAYVLGVLPNEVAPPSHLFVIDTATNTVTTTIPVVVASGFAVAVTPDGSRVYVAAGAVIVP
jgi:YVTN family beta-propeller protein